MADFPNTTWGMLNRLRESGPVERRAGLETLCRRYWEPIRSYARAAWSRAGEDDDLTQDFFLWLIESDVLEKFAPERGSFRHYLKGLLRNFSRNAVQAARAKRRGGGHARVPLDDEVADAKLADAEAVFERAWIAEVTKRAVERLKIKLERRPIQWRVFEAYDLVPEAERPTYGELAVKLAVKESDVRNALYAAREKFRGEVSAELRDTVSDAAELETEWRRVIGV